VTDPPRIYALATLLAAAGMWLLLPRGAARTRWLGALLMAVALGLWAAQLPWLGSLTGQTMFFVLAGVTVVAAVGTVSLSNPVYCAIWFGMSLLGVAAMFLYQGAQFLAVATVVVFAGAILVTFLFVLMLAQPKGRAAYDRVSWEALVSASAGMVMVGVLSIALAGVFRAPPGAALVPAARAQQVRGVLAPEHTVQIGRELFGRHLIAVEIAGTLLLAALVGAATIVVHTRGKDEK
jgi:NADH-quinone oxidoreductase subunit J